MRRELIFEIRGAEEGDYCAHALGHAKFTEAENWDDLRAKVLEAASLHFEVGPMRLRLVRLLELAGTIGNGIDDESGRLFSANDLRLEADFQARTRCRGESLQRLRRRPRSSTFQPGDDRLSGFHTLSELLLCNAR